MMVFILCSYYCYAFNNISTLQAISSHAVSTSLKTWLYGLFAAEAHFYSVNAQRNCLSAACRGAQHVVG